MSVIFTLYSLLLFAAIATRRAPFVLYNLRLIPFLNWSSPESIASHRLSNSVWQPPVWPVLSQKSAFELRTCRTVSSGRQVPVPSREISNEEGRLEKYNIIRNRIRFYNSVGSTARYQLKAIPENLENLIYSTLKHVIDKHPVLGISIINEDTSNPCFRRLEELDLTRVVEFTDATDICATLEDHHQKPFEDLNELPLWRLVISRSPETPLYITVSFFVHHGICDGTSGVAFHHAFLHALNHDISDRSAAANLHANAVIQIPRLELLPPIETVHALPISPFHLIGEIIKSFWTSSDPQCWTGAPISSSPIETCLRLAFLSNSQSTAINQACRTAGVTFTALLSVLVARALATCAPTFTRFRSTTPMSFRRFTGTDQKAMVCYVSAFSHQFSSSGESNYIPCSGDFSWNAVETCHREIKVATASPRNQKIGLLRFLSDYEGFFRKQVGQEREFSFEISNVGGMDVESGVDHCAGIDRIIFSQSSNVVGSALAFSIASVNGGDLAIALTWQKGIVEDDLAVKVLQTLEAELAAFAYSQTN